LVIGLTCQREYEDLWSGHLESSGGSRNGVTKVRRPTLAAVLKRSQQTQVTMLVEEGKNGEAGVGKHPDEGIVVGARLEIRERQQGNEWRTEGIDNDREIVGVPIGSQFCDKFVSLSAENDCGGDRFASSRWVGD